MQPEEPPVIDVLISDIRMPGVNGMRILEGIQELPGIAPVILITAFGDQTTHDAARRWGAKAVFDKPFDVDDLLQSVHDVVKPAA
jgi:two-component system, response regulator, stage 0 sporulation protein F